MIPKTRILIVDDDEDIRANIADILDEFGYETETAEDGREALAKMNGPLASRPCGFDLCLLDYKMPGMDGAELFDRIRSRCPGVRAIMITAYAGDDGAERAFNAGMLEVLRKPVDIDSLLGLIKEATA